MGKLQGTSEGSSCSKARLLSSIQRKTTSDPVSDNDNEIIDLSVVNTFLHVSTFKMETAEVVQASLQIGEWVASIDLTDAYFHVPIHQKFQKYLRFHVQGRAYQFRSLPFRIATAPLEFTQVVKEVKFIALSQGVRIHQYLDDWLVGAKDPDSCARDVQTLITLVEKLGWIVNLKKNQNSNQLRISSFWVIVSTFEKVWSTQIKRN